MAALIVALPYPTPFASAVAQATGLLAPPGMVPSHTRRMM